MLYAMDTKEMNNSYLIHNHALKYCSDRYHYWVEKYQNNSNTAPNRYQSSHINSDLDYNLFPRYNVQRAILTAIESVDPRIQIPESGMRELLILAAQTGESVFTEKPKNSFEKNAIAEEREITVAYFEKLRPDPGEILLPFRYRFSNNESIKFRTSTFEFWNINDSYWYPLSESDKKDIIALQADIFLENFHFNITQTLNDLYPEEHIYEIDEDESVTEMDIALLDCYYGGSEKYWTNKSRQWIIYASHENSLTLGGKEFLFQMLNAIKEISDYEY